MKKMVSDPEMRLVGASKELVEVRKGWNGEQHIKFGVAKNMEWSFIMAAFQHENGVSEIMARVAKAEFWGIHG